MRQPATPGSALLPFLLSLLLPAAAGASTLSTSSSADSVAGTISVHWSLAEWPGYPTGHPEWVGYDVLRRSVNDCGDWVRVSPAPFPRTMDVSESFTYTDAPPQLRRLYEYRVILVDADRDPIYVPLTACECFDRDTYASCPPYSAPVTAGTLSSGSCCGPVVVVCEGSCFPTGYIVDLPDALLGYVDMDKEVAIFGTVSCCSVEGPTISVHHVRFWTCETALPAHAGTWGQLKVLYR